MTATSGIVLAGGRSSRMGTPKAGLEWHGSTLLRRVAGIVGRVTGPVLVVRTVGQPLPALAAGVRVVDDAREGRGPLQGMLAGLEALDPDVEVAYVCAVDMPMLQPRLVLQALEGVAPGTDAAVPRHAGRAHPLAAAYRAGVLPVVARLVAADRLRMGDLLDGLRVTWLEAVPPDCLRNLNDRADYAAARALPPPAVTVRRDGAARSLRAATLGAAAGLGTGFAATIDGEPVAWDSELPLVDGDVVALRAVTPG